MNNKGLLPCPFCGGEAKFDNRDGYVYIICDECGSRNFGFSEEQAFDEWNSRVQCVDSKSNSSEFPNSSKEMPLVPKWKENEALAWIVIEISQFGVLFFDYRKEPKQLIFSIRNKVEDICHYEVLGTFNTLKEAKAKANELIKELGERLIFFAENIRTKE